jgi:CDP-6-deoxy-D-xylo-4-hexulose-3-dehydrase
MEKNKNYNMNKFYLPLMDDNIDKEDINSLINFLNQDQIPKLTNGPKVIEFENKWGEWLGTKYNLMVNSGASANELTMLALNYIHGKGEIIVPPLTWISDISSVIFSGFKPVFCDINLKNLSFDINKLKQIITTDTKAIFLTHVLGINGLTDELLQICNDNNILLIEDVCESHGATFKEKKAGSIGFASNFSFYFAHHMSTIEGGIICTNDEYFYQICRALRSHGMVREMTDEKFKQQIIDENPDLNKDFIFLNPAHNFRSTEINAVLGLSQIKKLDNNNSKRINNFEYFIEHLDSSKYITDIEIEGQCNYAFIIILKESSFEIRDKIESTLKENKIEFRRGLSGGGNQLRQPYFKENYNINYDDFKNTDHIHHFSWYVGNYPTLKKEKIDTLINILNNI